MIDVVSGNRTERDALAGYQATCDRPTSPACSACVAYLDQLRATAAVLGELDPDGLPDDSRNH